jgi:hypothetical protein
MFLLFSEMFVCVHACEHPPITFERIMFKPISPIESFKSKSYESISSEKSIFTAESSSKKSVRFKDLRHDFWLGTPTQKQDAQDQLHRMVKDPTNNGFNAAVLLLNLTFTDEVSKIENRAAGLNYFYITEISVPETPKMKAQKEQKQELDTAKTAPSDIYFMNGTLISADPIIIPKASYKTDKCCLIN